MRTFRARRSGDRCGICDEDIVTGEEACYFDDELCHADCAADEGAETEGALHLELREFRD